MMQEDTPNKRNAALQATLKLISEQGFHGAPMSKIAERANVGVGTIYRYFDNKEDLLNALYVELKTRMMENLAQNYSEVLPVREGFQQFFRAAVHYLIEHPSELSFAEQYENSPLITPETRQATLQIADPIQNLFERAARESLLKALPLELLGAIVSGSTMALAKLYLSNTIPLEAKTLDAGVDAIWDAIKR